MRDETIGYGYSLDLGGGDFGEIDLPTRRREWMPNGADTPAVSASTIPQMSRPYKGVWPITQFFGPPHYGLDVGMPTNTPLYAAHAGQVLIARADTTGYGFVICIKDDSRGLYTVYGHLNGLAGIAVRAGQWVAEREYIGRSDNTGNSTGPHLHVELRIRPYSYPSTCINPLPYMAVWDDAPAPTPPPTPTPTGNRARTLRNSPVIKKNTGRKIGMYPAGVTLTVGGVNGEWTYVPGQFGQRDGWVKTANLVRL